MMYAKLAPRMRSPGACLDDLLASRFLPGCWANRIWSARELPVRLEQCTRNLAPDAEWRAYGAEQQIFFAIARSHSPPMTAEYREAIDVYFLDGNASVFSAGIWDYDNKHGWWLDSVLELSYDCEHGWWLDAVMDMPEAGAIRGAASPKTPEVRRFAALSSNHAAARREGSAAKTRRTRS